MTPEFLEVTRVHRETADVVSFDLAVPESARERRRFGAGQFHMLYAWSVGEVPISISGDPSIAERLTHTVRAVGPVSTALTRVAPGERVGLRGPFGNTWPVEAARGGDLLLVAGGIGLMPLRSALYHALAHRADYGRVILLYGANRRGDLLFRDELACWQGSPELELGITLAQGDAGWRGHVGFVTALLPALGLDPASTVALLCGPEVMFRATAQALDTLGVGSERVYASFERNMKCGVGTCGHCQYGPHFLCRDGPVFRLDTVAELMKVREI